MGDETDSLWLFMDILSDYYTILKNNYTALGNY